MKKKSYVTPTLVEFGRVEDLTQTGCPFNKEWNTATDSQLGALDHFFEEPILGGTGLGDCGAGYS